MFEGFIGFLLGVLFVFFVIRQLFKHIDEAMTTESSDEDRFKLRVELVENQLLCYNNSTMTFICQGSSLKEVLDNFNKRFPGQDVTLVSEDAGLIEDLSKQKQLLDV
jgi:hypothetical protein